MDIIIKAEFSSYYNNICQVDGCAVEVICSENSYKNNSHTDSDEGNDRCESYCSDCKIFHNDSEDDE